MSATTGTVSSPPADSGGVNLKFLLADYLTAALKLNKLSSLQASYLSKYILTNSSIMKEFESLIHKQKSEQQEFNTAKSESYAVLSNRLDKLQQKHNGNVMKWFKTKLEVIPIQPAKSKPIKIKSGRTAQKSPSSTLKQPVALSAEGNKFLHVSPSNSPRNSISFSFSAGSLSKSPSFDESMALDSQPNTPQNKKIPFWNSNATLNNNNNNSDNTRGENHNHENKSNNSNQVIDSNMHSSSCAQIRPLPAVFYGQSASDFRTIKQLIGDVLRSHERSPNTLQSTQPGNKTAPNKEEDAKDSISSSISSPSRSEAQISSNLSLTAVLLYSFRRYLSPLQLLDEILAIYTAKHGILDSPDYCAASICSKFPQDSEISTQNIERNGNLLTSPLNSPKISAKQSILQLKIIILDVLRTWWLEFPFDFSASTPLRQNLLSFAEKERKKLFQNKEIVAAAELLSREIKENGQNKPKLRPMNRKFSIIASIYREIGSGGDTSGLISGEIDGLSMEEINRAANFSVNSLNITQKHLLYNDNNPYIGIDLSSLSPFDIARELTLISAQLASNVKFHELIDLSYKKTIQNSVNSTASAVSSNSDVSSSGESVEIPIENSVQAIIDHFNTLVNYIITEILEKFSVAERLACYKLWLSIAELCSNKLYNFHLVFVIQAALNSYAVFRLNYGEKLADNHKFLLNFVNNLCSNDNNYEIYRALCRLAEKHLFPFVPHYGILLKDLATFYEENSKEMSEKKIDLCRIRHCAQVISKATELQQRRNYFTYFQSHGIIRNVLLQQIRKKTKSSAHLEKLSLRVKPRKKT
jgi:hypothetical protein